MKLLTLTLRNARGEVVGEIALEDSPGGQSNRHAQHNSQTGGRDPHDNRVTEAQRRLLFRLAARLGYESEAARQYIGRRLGPEPDKRAASRLIDDLQDELKRTAGGRDERAS